MTDHKTDIVIIGAGPVGLFAIFEAGMLKMARSATELKLSLIGFNLGRVAVVFPLQRKRQKRRRGDKKKRKISKRSSILKKT